eukprot:TRINITY_DN4556_c0_g1_i1.p1 TRINITY_DN4556_c0_g1~~TRINITY_DN4556_c0_g1_i1.p1  ORF type:complete len:222 (-),score=45.86 TRINITY_DN4556_c0_g1_i1:51-716(-)
MDVTSLEQLINLPQYKQGILVICFWAKWSKPSLQINGVVESLQKQNSSIKFVKVEAEEVGDITEKFEVDSVPAVVFLKNGVKVETLKGANPAEVTKLVASLSHSTTTATATDSVTQPAVQEDLNERIKALINSAKVMAFIKGTPALPQCGFSSKFCAILRELGIQYSTFNILSDPAIREGIKKYSNWPTFPQLYIKGELVGGLDIVKELAEQGELLNMANS